MSDIILSMSAITDRIEMLLIKTHQRRADICRATGIGDSTIRGWINGKMPAADSLYLVAQFFGVTCEWLISGEGMDELNKQIEKITQPELDIVQPLNFQEQKLVESFRKLEAKNKNAVLIMAQSLEKCSQ